MDEITSACFEKQILGLCQIESYLTPLCQIESCLAPTLSKQNTQVLCLTMIGQHDCNLVRIIVPEAVDFLEQFLGGQETV